MTPSWNFVSWISTTMFSLLSSVSFLALSTFQPLLFWHQLQFFFFSRFLSQFSDDQNEEGRKKPPRMFDRGQNGGCPASSGCLLSGTVCAWMSVRVLDSAWVTIMRVSMWEFIVLKGWGYCERVSECARERVRVSKGEGRERVREFWERVLSLKRFVHTVSLSFFQHEKERERQEYQIFLKASFVLLFLSETSKMRC